MKKADIIIQGIKLRYYELGSGDDLIFFHGGRLRALTFCKVLTALSKEFHVLAPDIPGYGRSSTPTGLWTLKEYAKFFLLFLNKIKIKKVILIGYSLGGGIAYNLANLTTRIRGLVLIDSAGIEKRTDEVKGYVDKFVFYLTHLQYIATFFTLLKEGALFILKHLKDIQLINSIRKTCNDSSGYLPNIITRTSIIWAQDDTIFPIKIGRKLSNSIKSSKLLIVNGNHDWVLYKQDEFINAIKKSLMHITQE